MDPRQQQMMMGSAGMIMPVNGAAQYQGRSPMPPGQMAAPPRGRPGMHGMPPQPGYGMRQQSFNGQPPAGFAPPQPE